MRDIKFRAKRIDNNEWVYGSLVIDRNSNTCIIDYADHVAESYTWHDVIPESVGQFTGLKDKAGKDIYEGDILKPEVGANQFVEYREDMCRFITRITSKSASSDIEHGCEIIGNIHDTPIIK
jgi:uncharacterized phage protein (TIGR01671 family)